jgi:hypothetical protein
VRRVAGLDNTTDVATKHADDATLTRRRAVLGLVIFTGEFWGARAAGEEQEGQGNALVVVITFLAAAGAHALLERCGHAARAVCAVGSLPPERTSHGVMRPARRSRRPR